MLEHRVVIIGGGFGGINTARALRKVNCSVLIIDRTNHHLFQPLLYQVASAALSPGNIATPIREVLRNQTNATVTMSDVVSINPKDKEVISQDGRHFSYDTLIIAVGAQHSYFNHPEWEIYAPGLKNLLDAVSIREKILTAFEMAENCDNPKEAANYLRFAIVGAGPTGVEMAGTIAEIATKSLYKNFRKIRPELTEVLLIELASDVLPSYPSNLSISARKDLEKLGVIVLTNTKVIDIQSDYIIIQHANGSNETIKTMNVIWAAGNQASPLLQTLNVPTDKQGRVIVEPDLSIPGYPEVFVIGDAACCKGEDGNPLSGIAPVAIQQGKYVAGLIKEELAHPNQKRKPFHYFDKGTMATIGKAKAVAKIGKFTFTGLFAWLAWCFIHIMYLISFSNRIIVMIQWIFWFITGKRSVRIINHPIDDKKI
ncbi:MAG: NAD(P)/FAD-dependent oxidoreductase [Parachlamydiaceae bacterium]|nr:NAD(P)/FAD-dependent oxidoreductase [Parachlamydiaceae bacterium]